MKRNIQSVCLRRCNLPTNLCNCEEAEFAKLKIFKGATNSHQIKNNQLPSTANFDCFIKICDFKTNHFRSLFSHYTKFHNSNWDNIYDFQDYFEKITGLKGPYIGPRPINLQHNENINPNIEDGPIIKSQSLESNSQRNNVGMDNEIINKCQFCQETFRMEFQCLKHMSETHLNQKLWKFVNRYMCSKCNFNVQIHNFALHFVLSHKEVIYNMIKEINRISNETIEIDQENFSLSEFPKTPVYELTYHCFFKDCKFVTKTLKTDDFAPSPLSQRVIENLFLCLYDHFATAEKHWELLTISVKNSQIPTIAKIYEFQGIFEHVTGLKGPYPITATLVRKCLFKLCDLGRGRSLDYDIKSRQEYDAFQKTKLKKIIKDLPGDSPSMKHQKLIKAKNEKLTIKCDICEKAFQTNFSLEQHVRQAHGPKSTDSKSPNENLQNLNKINDPSGCSYHFQRAEMKKEFKNEIKSEPGDEESVIDPTEFSFHFQRAEAKKEIKIENKAENKIKSEIFTENIKTEYQANV